MGRHLCRGDLIIGKHHKSAICVAAERKARFVPLDLLTGYDAQTVRKTMGKRFKKPEPGLRKSLTLGQGHENSGCRALAEDLGIDVYFCHRTCNFFCVNGNIIGELDPRR
jgi:IS30 family transposase